MRNKIDYGIDLGTTNSSVCRMERGEAVIIKSDTLKDTMPSCVTITKRGSIRVGDGAFNALRQDRRRATKSWQKEASNTFVEFKRTMGTDTTYRSANLGRDLTSEELSAEVLKTLKTFVTDETVTSAVITVPAKFTVNQKTATIEAARMAGFEQCELLQEPIAASMAYGISGAEKDGLWIVFDFGGGTFDAALLKVEDGIMQVFDTEGDNYLGGKNLDYAIVDEILIPYLKSKFDVEDMLADDERREVLRDAMKTYAEDLKNQLSFKESEDVVSDLGELGEDDSGEELELDLTVSQRDAFDVMRPYFQKAVDICLELLKRNNIDKSRLTKLILVGGPTHSPLVRQMLREQVTPNVDTSIDPMTAVATGAALYASTLDVSHEAAPVVSDDVVEFALGCETTSVEETEWASISLKPGCARDKVWVVFKRGDGAWASEKVAIDDAGDVVELHLVSGRPNIFDIQAYDEKGNAIACHPNELTIIQGAKVGAAPLPYNIGIGVWHEEKERAVFRMARGLEKNRHVPAVGVVNDLKTTETLVPGDAGTKLCVPVYQTDDFVEAEGKSADLYEHVADVVITGAEVQKTVEAGSSVDVTLRVDSSEQMTLEVLFTALDYTVKKVLDTSRKQSIDDAIEHIEDGFDRADDLLDELKRNGVDVEKERAALAEVRAEYERNTEAKMTLQHLKEVLRRIEGLTLANESRALSSRLQKVLDETQAALEKHENAELSATFATLKARAAEAIRAGDAPVLKNILQQAQGLNFQANERAHTFAFLMSMILRYDSIAWKDRDAAIRLLDVAKDKLVGQTSTEELKRIAVALIELMPDNEADAGGLLR